MRCLLVGLLVIGGCASPIDTGWFVEFETEELARRAEFTRVAVYNEPGVDKCPEDDDDEALIGPILIGTSPTIPEIDDGRYCFTAISTDSACTTVGRGRIELELPLNADQDVVVVVSPVDEPCTGMCLANGQCTSADGGPTCAPGFAYCLGFDLCCPGDAENACSVASLTPELCSDPL